MNIPKTTLSRLTATAIMAAMIVMLTTGCDTSSSKAGYLALDNERWAYTDSLWFGDLASDTTDTAPRNLSVALRNSNRYRFSNLWLEVTYIDRGGHLHHDTVDIELCDNYGRWYGKGIGDLFQTEVQVASGVTLQPGSRVGVRHIMRVDTLTGIERVGIFAKATDNITTNQQL